MSHEKAINDLKIKSSMFSLEGISSSLHQWLYATLSPTFTLLAECVIVILAIALFAAGPGIGIDGKKSSRTYQIRLGPNRVGPGGMFQTVAIL